MNRSGSLPACAPGGDPRGSHRRDDHQYEYVGRHPGFRPSFSTDRGDDSGLRAVWRLKTDEIASSLEEAAEEAVANAPRRDGHFFAVPPIIE